MFTFDKNLKTLSQILKPHAPLYIVGGFVRDCLLSKSSNDIDLCSILSLEDLEEILNPTNFKLETTNKYLNTAKISISNVTFDYSRLRQDIYAEDGKHNPKKVLFVDDISLDAQRRDFSINALYYHIESGKIFDFYNGQTDLKNKIIKTIKTPEEVLSCDGERIFRMIKYAVLLDFSIDANTFETAVKYAQNTNDLSKPKLHFWSNYFKTLPPPQKQKAQTLLNSLNLKIDNPF